MIERLVTWITEQSAESVVSELADVGLNLWDNWFLEIIPELGGLITLLAGSWMMIGSMFSERATSKALGFWSAGMVVAVIVLEAA